MAEVSLKDKILDTLRNSKNTLYSMFLYPVCKILLIQQDLTYGRASLPYSSYEQTLRSSPYIHTDYKIPFLSNLKETEGHFIYYQTWQLPNSITKQERNVDVVFIHGLNSYGGKYSEHVKP